MIVREPVRPPLRVATIEFFVGDYLCAIPARFAVVVLDSWTICPVPRPRPGIRGCVRLADGVAPAIDLAEILLGRSEPCAHMLVTECLGRRFGLLCRRVESIAERDASEWIPPTRVPSGLELAREYVGAFADEDPPTALLDPFRLARRLQPAPGAPR